MNWTLVVETRNVFFGLCNANPDLKLVNFIDNPTFEGSVAEHCRL